MAVYTKRLAGPVQVQAVAVVLGTVPAGKVWIVRNIQVVNNAAGAALVRFSIGADGVGTRVRWVTVAGTNEQLQETRIVLVAGEDLRAINNGVSTTITVNGYEFAA